MPGSWPASWPSPDVDEALAAYEELGGRSLPIVLANRQVGPERMMELVEERAPDGFADLDDIVARRSWTRSPRRTSARPASTRALNHRPSLSVRRSR